MWKWYKEIERYPILGLEDFLKCAYYPKQSMDLM